MPAAGSAYTANVSAAVHPGDLSRVLVIAATPHELAPSGGWRTLCCGVGPVEAAAACAAVLAGDRPRVIVHVGIAGARRASGLVTPDVVVGTEAVYCDLGVPEALAPSRLAAPARLVEAVCRAAPGASRHVIGTSGRVGRATGCEVEAMEGFAVLRAAALAGVPAIEVRVISNAIEDTDRALWRFDEAFAAVQALTPRLVREAAACLR